jgi:hypothetical protein
VDWNRYQARYCGCGSGYEAGGHNWGGRGP